MDRKVVTLAYSVISNTIVSTLPKYIIIQVLIPN